MLHAWLPQRNTLASVVVVALIPCIACGQTSRRTAPPQRLLPPAGAPVQQQPDTAEKQASTRVFSWPRSQDTAATPVPRRLPDPRTSLDLSAPDGGPTNTTAPHITAPAASVYPEANSTHGVDDFLLLPQVNLPVEAAESAPSLTADRRGSMSTEQSFDSISGELLPPAGTHVSPDSLAPQQNEVFGGDVMVLESPGQVTSSPVPTHPQHAHLGAWWAAKITQPSRQSHGHRPLTINDLLASALQHSPEIRVLSDTPLVRDTAIIEAAAAFDWAAFMETTWTDTDEPVGSTLTTGGPPRFSNQLMQYDVGLRKQTATGGQFEVGQRYGWERSNSVFFIPNDQGTSRLTLSYTQPILRGAGKVYNHSLILLAQVEAGIARDEFSRELQGFLLDVTRGYWSLYLERAALLQREKLFKSGQEILIQLEARQATDAVINQVVRARAAVATRRSDLFRAATAVKNAEGRIRALVSDPNLGCLDEFELITADPPCTVSVPLCLPDVVQTAIQNRPEVHAAMKQIKASGVRVDLTKNELLPALDVVLETYVAGLRGDSSIGDAFVDQFSQGAPSYTAGIQLEVPLRNREARARFLRRALELRQFQNQFRSTLNALQLEVEVAVREVQTSYQEAQAKHEAMAAFQHEVDFIQQRWALLPGDDRSAALFLEDLLGAQERLATAEFEFASANVDYNLALCDLKRATGTLLQCEQVQVSKIEECGIPSLQLTKPWNQPSCDLSALEIQTEAQVPLGIDPTHMGIDPTHTDQVPAMSPSNETYYPYPAQPSEPPPRVYQPLSPSELVGAQPLSEAPVESPQNLSPPSGVEYSPN